MMLCIVRLHLFYPTAQDAESVSRKWRLKDAELLFLFLIRE